MCNVKDAGFVMNKIILFRGITVNDFLVRVKQGLQGQVGIEIGLAHKPLLWVRC